MYNLGKYNLTNVTPINYEAYCETIVLVLTGPDSQTYLVDIGYNSNEIFADWYLGTTRDERVAPAWLNELGDDYDETDLLIDLADLGLPSRKVLTRDEREFLTAWLADATQDASDALGATDAELADHRARALIRAFMY